MAPRKTLNRAAAAVIGALVVGAVIAAAALHRDGGLRAAPAVEPGSGSEAPRAKDNTVDLSDSQLASVKVAPVEEREFPDQKHAVGSIDFNQNMAVNVFTPYPGRIIT